MVAIEEYLDPEGGNRYRAWFSELDVAAAVKVTTALERLHTGTSQPLRAWDRVSRNIGSISVQAIGSILAGTVTSSSFSLGEVPRSGKVRIYRMQGTHGSNTSNAKGRLSTLSLAGGAVRRDRGTYSRFS
jgi:hypothetical protein